MKNIKLTKEVDKTKNIKKDTNEIKNNISKINNEVNNELKWLTGC